VQIEIGIASLHGSTTGCQKKRVCSTSTSWPYINHIIVIIITGEEIFETHGYIISDLGFRAHAAGPTKAFGFAIIAETVCAVGCGKTIVYFRIGNTARGVEKHAAGSIADATTSPQGIVQLTGERV